MRNPFKTDEELTKLVIEQRVQIAELEASLKVWMANFDKQLEEFRIRLSAPVKEEKALPMKDSDWLIRRKQLEERFAPKES